MPLTPVDKLGPYEILALVGIGEVYHEHDASLSRNVAIKILPVTLAQDRSVRFERKAKALAAMNHPNIAFIARPEKHRHQRPRRGRGGSI